MSPTAHEGGKRVYISVAYSSGATGLCLTLVGFGLSTTIVIGAEMNGDQANQAGRTFARCARVEQEGMPPWGTTPHTAYSNWLMQREASQGEVLARNAVLRTSIVDVRLCMVCTHAGQTGP